MRLALGVLFIWLGAACLWVAMHGTQASTPWAAFGEITGALKGGDDGG